MPRSLALVAVAAALCAGPAFAQPEPEPRDGKVTVPLTVTPAAPPKPLSRYYLLPEYRDLQPGDKLSGFLKCFMEQDTFFNRENAAQREKWLNLPLADLPADVRERAGVYGGTAYDPPYANFLVYMDRAARYARVEWNEYFDLRKDGVYYLLPEVQKLRELGRVLHLRLRGEVKAGEFRRAVVTVQSMLGLAKLLETHPTLIGNLVGAAVALQAAKGLEEMVQQPGCPNLFWALADLPAPLIGARTGIAGERVFITAQFDDLLHADRPMDAGELGRVIERIEKMTKVVEFNPNPAQPGVRESVEALLKSPRVRYGAWAMDPDRVAAARKRLVEIGGLKPAAVAAFPPLQVIATDDVLAFEVLRDEQFRVANLPVRFALPADDKALAKRTDVLLAPLLLPSFRGVKQAEARLDQRVALLRTAEAIRLFAHENGGKLPASLDEIPLPLPLDPVSGKGFEYKLADGVATLSGANSSPGNPRTQRDYEIRLRK